MIAFTLPGGAPIYTYSLLLAAGVLIGLAGVAWRARPGEALPMTEAGMWALLAALIGARAGYVAQAWPAFRGQPLLALQVQQGGLSWVGALVGGLLALPLIARWARRSPGALADALLPLLAAVYVAAWLGCIVEGCGYGPPVTWGGMIVPDESGALVERFPLQILAALAGLALYWLTDQAPRRAAAIPGLRACLMLLGLAVVQLGAAAVLAPAAALQASAAAGKFYLGLPLDAWAAAALALLALAGLGLAVRSNQKRGAE